MNPYGQQYTQAPPAAHYAPQYTQDPSAPQAAPSPYYVQVPPVPPVGYAPQNIPIGPFDQQGYYGAPGPYYVPAPATSTPESGKATAALVCGIISIVFSSALIGFIPGIIAIVLGSQHAKDYGKNSIAFAGKVTGIIGTVLSVLMLLLMIAFFVFLFSLIFAYSSSGYPYSYDSYYSYGDLSTFVGMLF